MRLDYLSARIILINYFHILKMTIKAISVNNNKDVTSNQDYIEFLKKINESEYSERFDGLSKLKNRLLNDGENLSVDEVRMIIGGIIKIIKTLRNKYLKEFLS